MARTSITLAMAGLAAASPLRVHVALPEVQVEAPIYHSGWHPLGIPTAEEKVRVMLAAKQQNQDALTEFVAQVSNPAHAKYGQYMTMAEVNQFTKPSDGDMANVVDFLSASCDAVVDTAQGTVSCELTVAAAEALFNTEFRRFSHISTGRSVVRALDYTLPGHVGASLDAVFGLHGIPLPPKTAVKSEAAGMPPAVTPDVLYEAYKIKGVTPAGTTANKMAVAEFQGQFMNRSDLKAFFQAVPSGPPRH
mmetsp:Transcript_34012/g.89286  ORF Transcript_34012/g.89286 Transcript_34012/m.89286 type:complete len:249 (-) Transcript_34012:298-1044(-)